MVAAYSNFALINFYVAAFIAMNIILLILFKYEELPGKEQKNWRYWIKVNAINLLFLVITSLIVWEPLRKISKLHMLDFGGKSDVVSDTIYSVIAASFYHIAVPASILTILSWCVAVSIVLIALACVYHIAKGKPVTGSIYNLLFVNVTITGVLLITIVQHYVLKNDYFVGRFALFLYPLYILNVCFAFKVLYHKYERAVVAFSTIAGSIMLLTFLYNVNTTSYLDWEYDKDTRKMMDVLEGHQNRCEPGKMVRLGITWYFEPTVNFYRMTHKLYWLQPADREEGLQNTDTYFYTERKDLVRKGLRSSPVLFTSPQGYILVYNKK